MAIEELYAIAAAMRKVSAGQNATDIGNGLRARRPLIRQSFRANAAAVLPHRGGLNLWVAGASFSGRVSVGVRTARMNVRVGRAGHDLAGLDSGLVIHPTFSNPRMGWHQQAVPPDSISEPIIREGENALERSCIIAADHAVATIIGA